FYKSPSRRRAHFLFWPDVFAVGVIILEFYAIVASLDED
ncbi:hypothetical protein NQ317_009521, partial [Molorchus minor]